ncbi:hypothetical protein J6590_048725 [Homalodisca vitripennis]|nr:hypothetical protein J6590_048725 [Homalodisca vitripennis]
MEVTYNPPQHVIDASPSSRFTFHHSVGLSVVTQSDLKARRLASLPLSALSSTLSSSLMKIPQLQFQPDSPPTRGDVLESTVYTAV